MSSKILCIHILFIQVDLELFIGSDILTLLKALQRPLDLLIPSGFFVWIEFGLSDSYPKSFHFHICTIVCMRCIKPNSACQPSTLAPTVQTNSNTWLYYFHPIMYEVTHKIPILIILKSKFCWRDSILRQQKQLTIYLYMYQLIF